MHHPLENIRTSVRNRIIFPLIGLSLLLLIAMNVVGQPLITPSAPFGIVSLELARNVAQAQTILNSWDEAAQLRAAFSLGLDFLLIPLYTTSLTLTCLWAVRFQRERRRFPNLLVMIGLPAVILAWVQSLAAGLDIIENIALTHMLFEAVTSPWPQIASLCAISKFSLIAAGITYSLIAVAAYVSAAIPRRHHVGL
jgi:hypothetical protein